MRKLKLKGIIFLLTGMTIFSVFNSPIWASSPIRLLVTPKPLQAPSETTFIVVSEKVIPATIELAFDNHTHTVLPLKKEATHEYAASYLIRSPGPLQVTVEDSHHHPLLNQSYIVSKAPSHFFSKVVIAVIFFGISIWYWRRAQRYTGGQRK
ncbi:hypothetical protein [Sulfobacillus thermosulfidooxidans]|uniref:hypothetical protein n=1 Tax=Sulfobacillus thermosulfidooxidans TaxID=28034 RepID=UPI0006B4E64F|nr:hypothetical protein [Sulfobacillus thermosulfidooxidans]